MSVKAQAHINPSLDQMRGDTKMTVATLLTGTRSSFKINRCGAAASSSGRKSPTTEMGAAAKQPHDMAWSCVRVNNFDIDRISNSRSNMVKQSSYSMRCAQRHNSLARDLSCSDLSTTESSYKGSLGAGSNRSSRGPDLDSSYYNKISIHERLQMLPTSSGRHQQSAAAAFDSFDDNDDDDDSCCSADTFACDDNEDFVDRPKLEDVKPSDSCVIDFADFSRLGSDCRPKRGEASMGRRGSNVSRTSSRRDLYAASSHSSSNTATATTARDASFMRQSSHHRRSKVDDGDFDPLTWYLRSRDDRLPPDAQRKRDNGGFSS